MRNRFDPIYADTLSTPLDMRVYTSQLLGQESDLVLHGGGNTSVKIDNVLYVKGSGWNLDTIEKEGFAPVRLDALIRMASFDTLSDTDMVAMQRDAMTDPKAPNPSIEAILHAIIPFDFVDHTHADAVVTLTNAPDGAARIREIYGEGMLIVDYVMPGFLLAKKIFDMTRDVNWENLEGIILLNHGVFTFDNDPKKAYDTMIDIVTKAEAYLHKHASCSLAHTPKTIDASWLEQLRLKVSELRSSQVSATLIDTPEAYTLSTHEALEQIVHNGGLTPEHVIRIKPFPLLLDNDIEAGIYRFVTDYQTYFDMHATTAHVRLDPAPRYGFIKGFGAVVFGKDAKETQIISDIVTHTITAMLRGEALGGWQSLTPSALFEMEYWELEQAKLKK